MLLLCMNTFMILEFRDRLLYYVTMAYNNSYYVPICLCYVYTGLLYIRDFSKTSTMQALGAHFLDQRYPTKSELTVEPMSDEYLDRHMQRHGTVVWHPASSCKMGARGDKSAVVDPLLR